MNSNQKGSKGKINPENYVETNSDKILLEIASKFGVSTCAVYKRLKQLGFSYKKSLHLHGSRRRKEYQEVTKDIPPDKLVYIDESVIEVGICKDRGWSKIGKPIKAKKNGKYCKRTNIIAGYVNKKIIAPLVFYSSCNTRLFEAWIEQIKELKPGQYVVMDNASFHKSQRIKELIESVGCKLIFLPPYSPDLNPIEKFWANMKRWIRGKIQDFDELYDSLVQFFKILTLS